MQIAIRGCSPAGCWGVAALGSRSGSDSSVRRPTGKLARSPPANVAINSTSTSRADPGSIGSKRRIPQNALRYERPSGSRSG